jgi:alpha/beta superfamily hydrolase
MISANPIQFPDTSAPLMLHGAVGQIEALVSIPDEQIQRRAIVVICHPHPLHGGTMHNKVVTMLDRSMVEMGISTLRFNFRGVGASSGSHDDGKGELQDLLDIAQWVKKVCPDDDLWFAGFSFGAFVSVQAASHLSLSQLISIAPPMGRYVFDEHVHCPWLIIQGEEDDVISPQAVYDYVARSKQPPTLIRMSDAGHFFHRKLLDLRGALKNALKNQLPPLRYLSRPE